MYGVRPTDIDALMHLRNAEVTQICVGPHDIQFNFHPLGNISVQGRCELVDPNGQIIQVWEDSTRSGPFHFPDVLMSPVIEITIDSPKSFRLTFKNGMMLRVVDTCQDYESLSVGNFHV